MILSVKLGNGNPILAPVEQFGNHFFRNTR